MNIPEYHRLSEKWSKELEELRRHKMPVLAGNIAKRHIEEDFRRGGFTHNGFHKWKETKRQRTGGSSAGSQYGPLLSGSPNLSRSIQYIPGDGQVTLFTRVPYAAIHNRGGETHPPVTPKMRRFAWRQHYLEAGDDKKKDTFWKRLALTKKTKLTVKIPKRQFMPYKPGPELNKKINDKFDKEVEKIILSKL
ncbi:hypothetical protein [Bacteroides uniformis]|jgi:phage gpG-like protein|uniref:Mu-like prophage protein gpG n=1 Tax=Bacteroides uniformis TaxID=820 RepID=A0A3E4R2M6_BACUN|nr:hypothetical protein [Bacteroides uniformis]RGL13335.1 hypothetical protein DXC80_10275 [Bacteroides uniformis]DAE79935.1 MAG TPA: tail morphogenesis protein [Caudoviricetes sp.]DAE79936.1 MAG TPA: tail morphogenesis protein [Caudoviricetes sp.]